jgi:hypothetical protein
MGHDVTHLSRSARRAGCEVTSPVPLPNSEAIVCGRPDAFLVDPATCSTRRLAFIALDLDSGAQLRFQWRTNFSSLPSAPRVGTYAPCDADRSGSPVSSDSSCGTQTQKRVMTAIQSPQAGLSGWRGR